MVNANGQFPSRPFQLRLETWYNWQNGSSVSVHVQLWIDKQSYSPTSSGEPVSGWWIDIDSRGRVAQALGMSFNFIDGNTWLLTEFDTTATTNSNGDVGVHAYASYDILGFTEAHAAIDGSPPSPPSRPNPPTASNITPNGMKLNWTLPSNNGSAIDQVLLRRFPSAAAYNADTGYTQYVLGAVTSHTVTGLTPGTTYLWTLYAHNGNGYSGQSGALTQATGSAVAPGMLVTPGISGSTATIAFTPPGGVSGVVNYEYEFRRSDWEDAGDWWWDDDAPATSIQAGLDPGWVYEWRGRANFGKDANGTAILSPWTAWTAVQQPNPNTNPGSYFDGSTPDSGGVDFAWTGTTDNSTSTATGVAPLGWSTTGTGGSSIIQRVTGARSGTYSARVVVMTTQTNVRAGMQPAAPYFADVEEGANYYGSIYAWSPAALSLTPEIGWYTAAGALVSRTTGTPVALPAGSGAWTRLVVSGVAPATAVRAVVTLLSPGSTLGGVNWTMDDAAVTLASLFDWFSGDSPDTEQFAYEWLGTPNASASSRTTLEVSAVDPLADPDCPPLPTPPTAPTIYDPCITEVGTWRRYWAPVPASAVTRWLEVVPTFRLTTALEAAKQVRMRVYPNPAGLPEDAFDASSGWESEQVISFIPPNTTIMIDGVSERVRASVGGGDWIAADQLLYGSHGAPAEWPLLDCATPYLIAFDAPLGVLGTNLSLRVDLTRRY